jgi:hypothetical protein
MTKENRERLYKHFRNMQVNYEARDGLNTGPTATAIVRERAKASADAILKKHPELDSEPSPPTTTSTKSKGKK